MGLDDDNGVGKDNGGAVGLADNNAVRIDYGGAVGLADDNAVKKITEALWDLMMTTG